MDDEQVSDQDQRAADNRLEQSLANANDAFDRWVKTKQSRRILSGNLLVPEDVLRQLAKGVFVSGYLSRMDDVFRGISS